MKLFATILFAMALTLPNFAQISATENDSECATAESCFVRAIYSEKAGRKEFAIADLTRALVLRPGFAEAYFVRGSLYSHNRFEIDLSNGRNSDLAVADFTKFIVLRPKSRDGYLLRGTEYLQAQNYLSALRDFADCVKVSSDENEANECRENGVSVYRAIAETNMASAKYSVAIKSLDDALAIDSENAELWGMRGRCNFEIGKFEEAVNDLTKAIEKDEIGLYTKSNYTYRAKSYRKIGKLKLASADELKSAKLK